MTSKINDSLDWIGYEHVYITSIPYGMTIKEYFDCGKKIDKSVQLDTIPVTIGMVPIENYDVQPLNVHRGIIYAVRSNYGN